MKPNFYTLLTLIALVLAPVFGISQSSILMVSKDDASLRIADSTSNTITNTNTLSASGSTITGINGLAVHPCSGEIYANLKISGQSTRYLGLVDTSGPVTVIGSMGDQFAAIAFDSNGVLYGVTGDGANTPETMYTINLSTGAATFAVTLGNGSDGECIAYNPEDGYMYHWSGLGTNIFEKINLTNYTATNIPFTNTAIDLSEVFAATYYGNGQFLLSNIDDSLFLITSAGYAISTGLDLSFSCKGLAFTGQVDISVHSNVEGICPGDSATLSIVSGSSFQWYRNGQILNGATGQTLSTDTAGHYNCVVTTAQCGSDSSSAGFTLEEFNVPNVSLNALDSGFCAGQSVAITGSNGGSSQWFLNGDSILGATSNFILATEEGLYNMTKTNTNGCTDSSSVGVFIEEYETPNIALGDDKGVCDGDSAVLDAGFYPNASYSWTPSSTGQTKTVSSSGTYIVAVVSEDGCFGSDTIDVTILPNPVIDLGIDTIFCIEETYTLDAGSGFASYSWNDGSTGQTLVINETSAAVVTYIVTVENTEGCSGNDTLNADWQVCTGIAELNGLTQMSVYPNPTSGLINISEPGITSITVRDMKGQIISVDNSLIGIQSLEIAETGIYFIEAISADGLKVARVVVSK